MKLSKISEKETDTMEEFLQKFVELIENFIKIIKDLVAGVRKYNDEN